MGEVSIKRRKKKKKKKLQPSGSLEENPLTYPVDGYHGLRCAVSIEDSDECERSLQTRRTGEPSVTGWGRGGDGQEGVMRDYLLFLILKDIKLL